jgi:hypothetical protein
MEWCDDIVDDGRRFDLHGPPRLWFVGGKAAKDERGRVYQWLEQARLMSACLNRISGDISAILDLMEEQIYQHGLRDEPRRPDAMGRAEQAVTRISASGKVGFNGLDAELRE